MYVGTSTDFDVVNSQPNTYRVDYFTNTSGDYRNPVWGAYHHIDFTQEELAETVSGANFILRELVGIHNQLRQMASPES